MSHNLKEYYKVFHVETVLAERQEENFMQNLINFKGQLLQLTMNSICCHPVTTVVRFDGRGGSSPKLKRGALWKVGAKTIIKSKRTKGTRKF